MVWCWQKDNWINRESKTRPIHMWKFNMQQRWQSGVERTIFLINGAMPLTGYSYGKNEIWPIPHITNKPVPEAHRNNLKGKIIKHLGNTAAQQHN